MNICIICGVKRVNKEMLECLYCHGWVCNWRNDCADKHLGNCDKDPDRHLPSMTAYDQLGLEKENK